MDIKILWLRRRFNWMGQYSGYDRICTAVSELLPGEHQSVWQKSSGIHNKLYRRFLKRLAAKAKTSPMYSLENIATEAEAIWQSFRQKPDLVHVTYVENHWGILPDWKKRLSLKIVGTAHQPAGWWRLMQSQPDRIATLDALIVPASREVAYFEQYLPGRVFFIPHGIDTDFFRPQEQLTEVDRALQAPRCVFSGKHLRDFNTLTEVVDRVIARNPGIKFDMILPKDRRNQHDPFLMRMARHEQVCWHAGLKDEQLRQIYQKATMLVLPIIDCTANNALLEAIACGLPVISNNVGGLRDYTKNTFAELLSIGDVEGFVNAILNLADDFQEQMTRSKAAREFAEQNLTWSKIANQTIEVYQKIIAN